MTSPAVPPSRSRGPGGLTRRSFALALAAASCGGRGVAAPLGDERRIAVLDWALAETLVALGMPPAAVAEAPLYRRRVVTPALPPDVGDLGLRSWPSLERLRALAPDLIVALQGYGPPPGRLEVVAPTVALPVYTPEREPLRLARQAMADLADLLGTPAAVRRALDEADGAIDAAGRALRRRRGERVLIVKFANGRLVDVFGPASLFAGVLPRLGLRSAYEGATNDWGFATRGLDALAGHEDATIVIVSPGPPDALSKSALWHALPAVREGRVVTIPPVWVFGGVPSATRFATLMGDALSA